MMVSLFLLFNLLFLFVCLSVCLLLLLFCFVFVYRCFFFFFFFFWGGGGWRVGVWGVFGHDYRIEHGAFLDLCKPRLLIYIFFFIFKDIYLRNSLHEFNTLVL